MSYPSAESRDLITRWYERSQEDIPGEFTIFDKFISLWISFNGWGSVFAETDEDRAMLNKLKPEQLLVRRYLQLMSGNAQFQLDVKDLANFRIINMKYPDDERRIVRITNESDFGQVLEVIYQIRCNLFHGDKNPTNPHDRELVELSYKILSKVFKPIVDGFRQIS